mmetsp:Transcript_98110/g.177121  ORF Transcript_98110/g.177121 Transcript_98110/m.177121 type:complete len:1018 (-) Transcript_98110:62-3115(-)
MKRPAPEAIPEPQGPPKHPRIHPPVAIPAYPKPTRAVAGYVPAGSPVAKPNGPAPAAPGQAGTGTARPTSRAGAGAAQELEMYVVATIGDDGHEAAMKTLIGEYVEKGENHGRKVFQKVIPQGRSDIIDVLIYYWDGRDGDAFSGWWFGNKLGGSQVWSQCKDSGKIPPSTGWKIPWDGPVRDTLLVESKAAQMAKEAQAKLLDLTAEASALEESSKKVLEQAKLASQSGETAALADAEQELPPKVVALSELSRKVADAQRSFSGDMIKSFQQLGSQLRILQGSLNSEYTAIRSVRQKAESEEKQREQEEADTLLLEEILPEAISKTNDAEDEVEKAVITQEMIEACEEDLAMVKEAIAETESAAKAAQALVKEAKAVLTAKLAAAQRLGADSVRQKACDELGKLQEQLQIAQQKLEPLKTLRQDWDQKRRTKKTVAEVAERLVMAEVDIDRIEEMLLQLKTDSSNKDWLKEVRAVIKSAEDRVNLAARLLDAKKESFASGPGHEELQKLESRVAATRSRLAEQKSSLKEADDRLITIGYLAEASSKLGSLMDAIRRLEDSERTAEAKADGGEVALEVTLAASKKSEAAAATAQQASSIVRMFIQMKTLEVKRLANAPGKEAVEKLDEFQRQLDQAVLRLAELRAGIGKRKSRGMLKEAELQVLRAEALSRSLAEASTIWADDEKLSALSTAELKEASEQTVLREKEVNAALVEARKIVAARQIEAKGKEGFVEVNSELLKFQTRLAEAQTEVSKQRKLFSTVEQRAALRRVAAEVEKKLGETDEKVSKAERSVAALAALADELLASVKDAQEPNSKATKEAELLVQEAQIAVRTMSRTLESQARSQGLTKDSVAMIDSRLKRAQEKVQSAAAEIKHLSEQFFVRSILREAELKLSECEESQNKAADDESELQRVSSSLDPAEVGQMLTRLEKAIQAAVVATSGCKTDLSMKRLSIKRLSASNAEAANKALTEMISSAERVSDQLAKMRLRSSEERRRLFQRSRVEAAAATGAGELR